jgi:hypothetical protein
MSRTLKPRPGYRMPEAMRVPTSSGPCAQCGLEVRINKVTDQIAHAEPVCAAFERMMTAAGQGQGIEAVADPWGGVVPIIRGTK